MRRIGYCLVLVGGLFLGTGCASTSILRVTSYWGEAINLYGTGRTFAWAPRVEGEAPATPNPSFDSIMHETIARRMQSKGYIQTEPGSADMWLSYRVGMQVPQPRPGIEHVEEGALAIDILEPQTRRIIWVGTALVRVDHSTPPDARRQRIRAGVRKVLYQFPNRDRD